MINYKSLIKIDVVKLLNILSKIVTRFSILDLKKESSSIIFIKYV